MPLVGDAGSGIKIEPNRSKTLIEARVKTEAVSMAIAISSFSLRNNTCHQKLIVILVASCLH